MMKTMEETKVIDGTCPTCGIRKPAKPICKMCNEPILDWPDDGQGFLLAAGWRPDADEPGRWRQPLARLRTEAVIVKEGEKLVNDRLQPVYRTYEPDTDSSYPEKDAVNTELELQRGPQETITYSKLIFDDKMMADARAKYRDNRDSDVTARLEAMKRARSNICVSPCTGCGSWPDGHSKKSAHKKSLENPAVETNVWGWLDSGVPLRESATLTEIHTGILQEK